MEKKTKILPVPLAALLCVSLLLPLCACRRKAQITLPATESAGTTAAQTAPQTSAVTQPPASTTLPAQTAPVSQTEAESASSVPLSQTAPASSPAATSAAASPEEETVTLPIELPAANGTMEVSVDPLNALIRAVAEDRGLDVSLLAAVYAVPQSGQNYVFEFSGAGERSASALRRVYLLTDDLQIKSVAAANAAEREHISMTENWFCMNVLIKGVIFPSVEEKMQ